MQSVGNKDSEGYVSLWCLDFDFVSPSFIFRYSKYSNSKFSEWLWMWVITLELFHVVNPGDSNLLLFLLLSVPLYRQLVQLHWDDVMVIYSNEQKSVSNTHVFHCVHLSASFSLFIHLWLYSILHWIKARAFSEAEKTPVRRSLSSHTWQVPSGRGGPEEVACGKTQPCDVSTVLPFLFPFHIHHELEERQRKKSQVKDNLLHKLL